MSGLQFIDTHCHIHEADAAYNDATESREKWLKNGISDADKLVTDAFEQGVSQLVCIGTTLPDSAHAIAFAARHPEAYVSIGLHPHEAGVYADDAEKLGEFAALATGSKVVAVGECGLDYFYDNSPREAQIRLLKWQIELAQEHDLPMVFHVREAFDDFWPIFDLYHTAKPIRGVLHSFTDSFQNMQKAVDKGLFIGVNGIATFNKNPELLRVHKELPLERILLETDSPFLTPVPYRGRICEPKHVVATAEFLGNLRQIPVKELSHATLFNSKELFGI